ncbi:quaternary amine ABC transporter ATP-binding protein [Hutsoniella sourekii]|uniref:quaternary amine ABC transporter ATP-binding protein n=1 Tax=Hutsoniella sourekii TaxID=87650 RepID=UPI0004833B6C|nr:glycine betaine/L-proline ABC transporter ATP-binding protein [Hutsoniella sourekii]
MAKLSVRNLTKIFGNQEQVDQALDLVKKKVDKNEILNQTGATVGVYDASFDVNEGEIFVIMGLSGSGKSTLIRLLNRLIEPTSGDILIDGENVSDMDKSTLRQTRRDKINMVFQSFALYPHRTLLENVEYGLEVRGVDKKERQERAERALDNANLLDFKDQYPDQLSGGMQQRVGLARALANDPDILLMDEAFSALDPLIRKDMQDELIELQASQKRTIIFITHDLNEALRIGDRIAIMKDGRIMQIGTGEEILMEPDSDFVRDFVVDVDRSKVLTAENIMVPAISVDVEGDTAKSALHRMRHDDVNVLLAVTPFNELVGFLDIRDVALATKGSTKLGEIVDSNVVAVEPTALVEDLFDLMNNSPAPIVVVDDDQKVQGVIRRRTILDALTPEDAEEDEG